MFTAGVSFFFPSNEWPCGICINSWTTKLTTLAYARASRLWSTVRPLADRHAAQLYNTSISGLKTACFQARRGKIRHHCRIASRGQKERQLSKPLVLKWFGFFKGYPVSPYLVSKAQGYELLEVFKRRLPPGLPLIFTSHGLAVTVLS